MARQNDVKTLAAITGQPTEDVVAMLKQYNGDVNAATNALMDSAFPSNRAFSGVIGTMENQMAVAGRLDFPA